MLSVERSPLRGLGQNRLDILQRESSYGAKKYKQISSSFRSRQKQERMFRSRVKNKSYSVSSFCPVLHRYFPYPTSATASVSVGGLYSVYTSAKSVPQNHKICKALQTQIIEHCYLKQSQLFFSDNYVGKCTAHNSTVSLAQIFLLIKSERNFSCKREILLKTVHGQSLKNV